jgi:hypothetical protein
VQCWPPKGAVFCPHFLRTSRTPRVFLKCSMSYCDVCFCLSKKFSFFLFLSIYFIRCQLSPAFHITNPFYNSLHFSGLLQTTGLTEIGSLCVCVLEDGLASSLLHACHSQGPRPIAVRTCGQTLKRKHANVWWKWTDIPSREVKEKRGWEKRANRLCKSGIIPFAERNGHASSAKQQPAITLKIRLPPPPPAQHIYAFRMNHTISTTHFPKLNNSVFFNGDRQTVWNVGEKLNYTLDEFQSTKIQHLTETSFQASTASRSNTIDCSVCSMSDFRLEINTKGLLEFNFYGNLHSSYFKGYKNTLCWHSV